MVRNAPTFTINLSEASNRLGNQLRNIPESVNITESRQKVGIWIRNIPETINISEASNRIGTWVRNIPESVNINEASNKIVQGFAALVEIIDETINLTENAAKLLISHVKSTTKVLRRSTFENSSSIERSDEAS